MLKVKQHVFLLSGCVLLLLSVQFVFSRAAHPAPLPESEILGDGSTDSIRVLISLAGENTLSSPVLAIRYYNRALDMIRQLKILDEEASVYNFMGRVYEQQGIYDLAMEYYFKSMALYEEIGDENAIYWAYSYIGNVYYVQKNYQAASEYYFKALEYFNRENDDYGRATTLNNIALVKEDLNQLDTALVLFREALIIRQKIGDPNLIAHSFTYIGRIYGYRNQNTKALDYFQKSFDIYNLSDDKNGMAFTSRYLGDIYLQAGDIKKAQSSFTDAVTYYREAANNIGVAETYSYLAELELSSGDLSRALQYGQKMKEVALSAGVMALISDAYLLLSNVYEKQGKSTEALSHYKYSMQYLDSVRDREVAETISRQEFLYERSRAARELELRENKIELLENAKRIDRIKRNALLGGIVLLLVIAVLIYSRQYNIHKRDREIIRKNEEIRKAQDSLVKLQQKEQASLKAELMHKQSELSNFALHIIHKNDLLKEVSAKLRGMQKCDEEEKREKLNELVVSVSQNKRLDQEIRMFQKKVDTQNKAFFKSLENRFPDLTANDKRIISLLRLNLSTKEIASLNNTSEKAVEMGRYRLRKKLNLGPHDNINTFLKAL